MDLRYYRRGHGSRVRAGALALYGVFLAAGCYEFHQAVVMRMVTNGTLPKVWVERHLDLAVMIALYGLAFLAGYAFLNRPRPADFLVEVDLELNKVTWATKQEVGDAASVVFVTIIFLTVVLAFVDVIFGYVARVLVK